MAFNKNEYRREWYKTNRFRIGLIIKLRRQKKTESGLCNICFKNPQYENLKSCLDCRIKMRKKYIQKVGGLQERIKIKKVCPTCKNIFFVSPSSNRGGNQCCCFECSKIWKKGKRLNTGRTHFKKGVSNNIGENNPMYGHRLDKHPQWKGGKTITKYGYVWIQCPIHPNNNHGYVWEHRLIVEKFIGRLLTREEVVHHLNEDKQDNRIENLMIFPNSKTHMAWHTKLRQYGYLTNPMKRQIENRWKEYGK